MGVPVSEIGAATGYPCNDHRLIQDLNNMEQESTGSGVAIGMIFFWGDLIANLPAGCVICDGTANSSGSGLNLLNCFIKGVGTNADNNQVIAAGETDTSGEHTHNAVATEENITGVLQPSSSGVGSTTSKSHEHTGFTTDTAPALLLDGHHFHLGKLVGENVELLSAGLHAHSPVTVEETTIDNHDCADVILADHPPHTHALDVFGFKVPTGPPINLWTSQAAVTGPNDVPLCHEPNTGAQIPHPAHTHPLTLEDDGEHDHTMDQHGHDLETDVSADHSHITSPHNHTFILESKTHDHPVDENEHDHSVVFPKHGHAVTVGLSGDHSHTMGDPPCIQLIAVERIS